MSFKKLCASIDCGRAAFAKGLCGKCRAKAYREENRDALQVKNKAKSRTVKGRYTRSKCTATKRGLRWDISLELFEQLIKLPCYYCGESTGATGTGLDRINNTAGYIPDNVLPCCGRCNTTRNTAWSVEQATAMIRLGLKMKKAA